jgi:hypothetical protein
VRGRVLLIGSMLAAIAVTVLTTVVLLLVEPGLSKAEAIKTGGLAGGAVVALYALWLNDRRRRTDEARHELESDRPPTSASRVQWNSWATRLIRYVLVRFMHWHGLLTPLLVISRPCSTCSVPIYAGRSRTPAT